MRIAIAAAVALLAAAPAAAENWVRIGGLEEAPKGIFIDADSIVRTGDRVRFKLERRWSAPRPEGWDREVYTGTASCADRKVAVLAISFHLADRTLMSMTYRENRAEAELAPPGSLLGLAAAHVCAAPGGG